MKTAIVCNIWMDGDDRPEKAQAFVDYYQNQEIKSLIGYQDIVFLDNGSKTAPPKGVEFITFPRLPHGDHETAHDYPHSWRCIYDLQEMLRRYDKILWLDADSYILSKRLAEYIRDIKKGWTSFFCKKYGFPEAGLQVICRAGGQQILEKYCAQMPFEKRLGRLIEKDLPFTDVECKFNCNRFGETSEPQTHDMDSYHQWTPGSGIKLVFDKPETEDDLT